MQRFMVMAAVCLSGWASNAFAENYFVNNLNGRDQNDGLSETPLNALTGPVKSITQAVKLAHSGDAIILANTGTPYYESISLVGDRLSGVKHVPFTIFGNGATLSGLRQVPRHAWRRVSADVWQISFNRKGFYRILRDGFPVPEHRPEDSENLLETLPEGHWAASRGKILFRQVGINEPSEDRFDYAADEMGITLYHVDHVRIMDLNVEHFRIDGINAHNMCREVELENVTSRENGRAGLAVGGSSKVVFRQGRLEANGRNAALVTGKGLLSISESALDVEPTVTP